MDKADYEEKKHLGVYIPSENRELTQIINVDYWTRWILNEIEWFQFKGILEHTDFHAKGDNIIFISLLKLFPMFSISISNNGG